MFHMSFSITVEDPLKQVNALLRPASKIRNHSLGMVLVWNTCRPRWTTSKWSQTCQDENYKWTLTINIDVLTEWDEAHTQYIRVKTSSTSYSNHNHNIQKVEALSEYSLKSPSSPKQQESGTRQRRRQQRQALIQSSVLRMTSQPVTRPFVNQPAQCKSSANSKKNANDPLGLKVCVSVCSKETTGNSLTPDVQTMQTPFPTHTQ